MCAAEVIKEVVFPLLRAFPNAPTNQLAKMLFRDYPQAFHSIEHARSRIRDYRGANGKNARKEIKSGLEFRDTSAETRGRYNIPESFETSLEPYILAGQFRKGMIIADTHIPYHNIKAIEKAFDLALENKCDEFIIMDGDFLDCYQLSRFLKNPIKKNFKYEVNAAKEVLRSVRGAFPKAKIVLKMGNHDIRYDKYIMAHAPLLFDIPEITLEALLEKSGVKFDFVNYHTPIYVDQYTVLHGDEFSGGGSPSGPARSMLLRAYCSIIMANFHKTDTHVVNTVRGETIVVESAGCLCELHPDFCPLNSWNHGCVLVERSNGVATVENRRFK